MEVDSGVVKSIVDDFEVVDQMLAPQGKFNSRWRTIIAGLCINIRFSTLQRAFQIRYGATTEEDEQPLSLNPSPHRQCDTMEEEDNKNNPDVDHDVMEEILRRLPVPSLMRAKAICKAWNRAISTTNFNVTNEAHHFVTQQNDHRIAFYCASLNQWFAMCLPRNNRYHPYSPRLHLCAAAANGLFLFLDLKYGELLILNLLTNQHRFLPSPKRRMDRTAVELIVHAAHFEIITIDSFNKVVHLYDSSTDEWTDIPTPFQLFGSNTHHWKSTLHNGMAYFTKNFGLHLGCYDIVRREFQFKEIEGGMAPQIDYRESENNFTSSLPSLLACNGKLILVGRLEEGGKIWGGFPFIEHTLVGIWRLDSKAENNESWALVSVTPRDLLEETVKSSHGTDFIVAASIDNIWLTIKGSINLLTFNLRSMEWNVLPGYTVDDLVDCPIPRRGICAPFETSPSFNLSPNPPEPIE